MCFSSYLGIGCGEGGGQTALALLMQFFTLYNSKIEVSKTYFFWYFDHLK